MIGSSFGGRGVGPVRRSRKWMWLVGLAGPLFLMAILGGGIMSIVGSSPDDCDSGSGSGGGGGGIIGADPSDVSGGGVSSIPKSALKLYLGAAKKYDIDWTFLASIGGQECDHGRCAGKTTINGSGCVGFMQLGVGGNCGDFFKQNAQDGDGDGKKDPLDDADSVATAAYGLRHAKGAPPAGGSFAKYRQAACDYYGACVYIVPYADQVMARAKSYGFPAATVPGADSINVSDPGGGGGGGAQCSGAGDPSVAGGAANFNDAKKISTPGKMVLMPAWATAKGYTSPAIFGGRAKIDSRVEANVLYMLKKYKLRVHDCLASGHNTHGNGSACDIVPEDDPLPQPGKMTPGWKNVNKLASDLGWKQPGAGYPGGYACNSGMPFKPAIYIICYNGDINHGDPDHITGGCACPHLHLSWKAAVQSAPVALTTPPPFVYVFPQAEDGGDGDADPDAAQASASSSDEDDPPPKRTTRAAATTTADRRRAR